MTRANPNAQARILGLIFALLLVAASGAILLAGTASAQSTANETSGTGTQIDTDLTLLESSYNETSGNATLRFQADSPQAVTLADAGAFVSDGVVNTRTVVLEDEQKVRINVSEVDGRVGVSISTEAVLFAHTIQDGSETNNPLNETSGTAGWLGGASVVVVMSTLAGWRELRKDPTEPEVAT